MYGYYAYNDPMDYYISANDEEIPNHPWLMEVFVLRTRKEDRRNAMDRRTVIFLCLFVPFPTTIFSKYV